MRTPHDPEPAADTTPIGARGPIVIGGLSKSGKTELRRVLERHADLVMERRTGLWNTLPGRYGDLSNTRNLGRCLDAIERSPEAEALGFDRAAIAAEFVEGPSSYHRLLALVHGQHASRSGASSWGIQLRGVENRAEALIREIPGVRVIHMVRDPRVRTARCAETGGRIVGGIGWETEKWLESARLALDGASRWPSQYLVVRCEDLAASPIDVVSRVTMFAGLDGDPAVDGAIDTVDWSVLEPVEPDSGIASFVERVTGTELEALGYHRSGSDARTIGWVDGRLGLRLSRAAARRRRHGTRSRA